MSRSFTGKYIHSIDAKGRVIVPVKFKNELGDTFMLSIGLDGCLYIFPNDRWDMFIEELERLPATNVRARKFKRIILTNSTECEVDKQGRILINQDLRNIAGLKKDVVFAGNGHRIEVWDKDRYESDNEIGMLEELAGEFDDLGIHF
jgi:MraZ protein